MKLDYILAITAFASIVLLVVSGVWRKKVSRGSGFVILFDIVIFLSFMSALVTTLWLRDKNPMLLAVSLGSSVVIIGVGFLAADYCANLFIKKPIPNKTAP